MKYNEKREEQLIDNELCMTKYIEAMKEFHNGLTISVERLRTCSAEVYETPKYYLLRSYRTFIAVIEKAKADTCYDVLRKVYGYTSTSAQHVSKFAHDYGNGKWGCDFRRTYREV